MREPFPLQWPEGEPRREPGRRSRSRFGVRGQVSFSEALIELRSELSRLGAANAVITTDLPVRRDGIPYAATGRVSDPGVAVWFMLPDDRGVASERVLACDRWLTHAENMRALALTIEAMRGLDRWGVAGAVSRVFAGFTALPPGTGDEVLSTPRAKPWREVLGPWPASYDALPDEAALALARVHHRKLITEHHPDRGGDPARAAEINAALDEAERELGA